MQAKRKKHAKKDHEGTANRHAAQIFAEMLGQVCHPEFYEKLHNEYQEVSPIPTSLTTGFCGSHSAFKHILILRQIAKHLSFSDFKTWRKIHCRVSTGQGSIISISAVYVEKGRGSSCLLSPYCKITLVSHKREKPCGISS